MHAACLPGWVQLDNFVLSSISGGLVCLRDPCFSVGSGRKIKVKQPSATVASVVPRFLSMILAGCCSDGHDRMMWELQTDWTICSQVRLLNI